MEFSSLLEDLKARRLYRRVRSLASAQGPRVRLEGREVLNFSSNDYLGLAADPRLADAAREAAGRWGTGSGASRLVSGSLGIHDALEEAAARFKGEEAALLFPAGFMANLGVLQALAGRGDTVWIDRAVHASIVDAARLTGASLRVWPHRDLDFLGRRLGRPSAGRAVVVTDSYFSMDGDTADLAALRGLTRARGALLVVDEAHANGVFGPEGRGLTAAQGIAGLADAVVGTFSKAFGSQGGFAAGRRDVIDVVTNRARAFIYTTAPAPPTCAAALAALGICESDARLRRALEANVRFLRERLEAAGFDLMGSVGPIIPILAGGTERALRLSERLLEKGFLAPAIRPPTVPKGTDRLRVTVTAGHAEEDIARFVEALAAARDGA